MAKYPIKMLKDEEGTPFVPLVSTEALRTPGGESIEEKLEKKLEVSNIKAGTDISLSIDGNNITINNASKGVLIDNLDTETSGLGSLDAHQGKVLKDMIPDVVNDLTTVSTDKALSAYQGYLLNHRVVPTGGTTGQVLKKSSDDDHALEWGDAADPNAIIGDGSIKKIVELTYEEYQALDTIDSDTEYHILDATSSLDQLQETLDDLQKQIDDLKIRKSNPIMRRSQNDLINWTQINTWAQMPFNNLLSQDTEFSSWSYKDGIITVGNNASRLRIKSTVAVHHNSWIMYGLFINDTQICKTIYGEAGSSLWYTLHLDKIIDVNSGDTISLKVYKDSSGTAILDPLITTAFKEGSSIQLEIEILE